MSYPDANYQHESLKPILEPTYGIILYQEQVMQIAQVLAGYTSVVRTYYVVRWVRKAGRMAKQRSVFKEGAEKMALMANFP